MTPQKQIQIPLLQNVQLSPQVCTKLQALGLNLSPATAISNNLLCRSPNNLFATLLSRVKIDSYSYVMPKSVVRNTSIGKYCSIGHNVEIGIPQQNFSCLSASNVFTLNSDFKERIGSIKRLDPFARAQGDEVARITIGNDVWVGAGVYIQGGVNIGSGAIIGTGSYICNDVPPYAIVGGRDGGENSKGIIKRYRFSDEVISDLLDLKWWEFDLPRLMASLQDTSYRIPFEDPKAFIAFMRNADTAYWPRTNQQWHYIVPQNTSQVQVIPVGENFDMGHDYPAELLKDSSWN